MTTTIALMQIFWFAKHNHHHKHNNSYFQIFWDNFLCCIYMYILTILLLDSGDITLLLTWTKNSWALRISIYVYYSVTRVLLVTTRVPSLSTYGLDSQENLSGKNEIQLALQQKRTISERGFYCKEHAKKSPTRDLCICQKYYDYRVRAEFQPKWALNY